VVEKTRGITRGMTRKGRGIVRKKTETPSGILRKSVAFSGGKEASGNFMELAGDPRLLPEVRSQEAL
jgi:hypothetical protein